MMPCCRRASRTLGSTGMRERSARIDGLLNVWSQPGAGTEIEMTVPAATAFGKAGGMPGAGGHRRHGTADHRARGG